MTPATSPSAHAAPTAGTSTPIARPSSHGRSTDKLGCGNGNAARLLAARGFLVTGIDISPAAIGWAIDSAGDSARFLVGNAVEGIPGNYDFVVDSHCLHCIIGADRQRLLANVNGALAQRGRLFVSTMCGAITIPALRATFDPLTRCQVVDGIARRYIGDANDILDVLRATGFDIVRSTLRQRTNDDDQDHLWALAAKR
jgi:SAM-dependent methyltransferase